MFILLRRGTISKTWTQKNLDHQKPGPKTTWTLKTWNLKNMDPEKHGINMGLKSMSDFRELCFIKTMRQQMYQQIRVLTDI